LYGKPKYPEGNLSPCHFVHHKFNRPRLRSNPGSRGGNLSYGTANMNGEIRNAHNVLSGKIVKNTVVGPGSRRKGCRDGNLMNWLRIRSRIGHM
jgi:hypothetical protein